MGILARIAEQAADRVAVEVRGQPVNFGRLLADVDDAAARFAASGIGEGMTVGLRAGPADNGHSYANWVAHLAAIKLGAGHVSLTDKAAIAAAANAGRIDIAVGPFDRLIDLPRQVKKLQFDCDPLAPRAAQRESVANREGRASRLNLTSGTTGRARFVRWDADLIERRVMQVVEDGVIGPDTRLHVLLHLRTTAGFRYPLATWAMGGCVILPSAAKGIEREREALPRANVIACSPPNLRERLAAIPGEWPGRAGRTIIFLGGRLPPGLRDAALERAGERLLVSYGATETGSLAIGDHRLIERHHGAVGFLRPGVEVEIVDEDGAPVPPGTPGRLRSRTPMMVAGYDREAADGEGSGHFEDGWFYPGDIACLFDDGLLAIEGRGSETLNLGGWKVAAGDLEAKAAAVPGVHDVCALTVPLPDGDLLTFAIVCDDDFDPEALRTRARTWVARNRPVAIVRLPEIPRNAMGKVPRAQLADELAAMHAAARKRHVRA